MHPDDCLSQVEDLKNLVNEFSRFARLPYLSPAHQDINELIRETLILYQENEPQVVFETSLDSQLPLVPVDREQLKRVLVNLLDNAIASIKHQGQIWLYSSKAGPGNGVRLEVADNGRGIADRDEESNF